MVGAALGVVLVPITGALSDRVGRKPVFRVGAWLALVVAFPVAALVQSGEQRRRSSSAFVVGLGLLYGIDLRPARGVLVRAVRHPLPLHGAQHALPDLRHRGLRPDPADRRLAGHPRRRQPVAGRGYNVVVAAISLALRALPAGDRGPRPRRPDRGEPSGRVLEPVSALTAG